MLVVYNLSGLPAPAAPLSRKYLYSVLIVYYTVLFVCGPRTLVLCGLVTCVCEWSVYTIAVAV
jgi:hypothetical protein